MARAYRNANPAQMLTYDAGSFHGDCPAVELNYPYLWCPDCHVIGHVDIVARHINQEDACLERGKAQAAAEFREKDA